MILSATIREIAGIVQGEIEGAEDLSVAGFVMLHEAGEGDLTFVGTGKHAKNWATSAATAALVSRDLDLGDWARDNRAVIRVDNADHALIDVLTRFSSDKSMPESGVHPSAMVSDAAELGSGVRVGPFAVISSGCRIGDNTVIESGVRIHENVRIGGDCHLHAGVVIREECELGDRVILHANVVIGADGFGYQPARDGSGLVKIPHLGNAVLGDDVEIGANSCVDRGKLGSTSIGNGTKIDNLCQVGHNCRIGAHCAISGLSGLGGSTTVGDGTLIGGGCGIADHLTIGRGVRLAARSGLMNDIPDGETWGGMPAKEIREAMKEILMIQRLPTLSRKIRSLLKDT